MRTPCLAPLLPLVVAVGCGGGGGGHSSPSSSSSGTRVTFAANSIVYGVANGTGTDYSVDEIAPTGGTATTVVKDVPGTILAFALDPSTASRYALAADPTGAGTYGVALSRTLSLSGATTLVAAVYTTVGSLAVTKDGAHVVYTATTAAGASELFVVPTAGGTPVDLGPADASTVSPADGDTIAYAAPVAASGDDQIFARSLAAGASGAATQVTTDAANHTLPVFSPDGTKLAYWTLGNASNALTVETLAGATTVSIPGVGAIEPQGEAFGPTGATLAIVGQSGTTNEIATLPADGTAGPTTIATASSLLGNDGFFWTDANGRAVSGGRSATASRARKR